MPSLHLVLGKKKTRSKGQAFQCVLQNRDFYVKRTDRVWKYINIETRTFYLPARKKHLPERYLITSAFRQAVQCG